MLAQAIEVNARNAMRIQVAGTQHTCLIGDFQNLLGGEALQEAVFQAMTNRVLQPDPLQR